MRIDGVTPVPTRILSFTKADGELVPAWFGDRDRPWLRDLIEDVHAFCGQRMGTLLQRWRDGDNDPRAGSRQAIAVHVLTGWLRRSAVAAAMREPRRQLFALAAGGMDRETALAQVAASHQLELGQLSEDLFADLPDQRRICLPTPSPESGGLISRANLALARGMLRHASSAEILIRGGSRTVLKTAWLRGMRVAVAQTKTGATRISWQQTTAGARNVLGSIVPLLPWTHRYRLRALCTIGELRGFVVLATGDQMQPSAEPRLYDSKLEQSFAREFVQAMPDWQLIREPIAIATPHGLAFPDFELRPRRGGAPWLCEIAGLRNPKALHAKLSLLDAHPRLILCLPIAAVPSERSTHPRLVAFRRRVPIEAVIEAIQIATV